MGHKNLEARRAYQRAYNATRKSDPAFRAARVEATLRWEKKNPEKKKAKNKRYQASRVFKASRKIWWEKNKDRQNEIRRAAYRETGGKKKARDRARRLAETKRMQEAAAQARRIQIAQSLVAKAARIAREKREYGITRKEAA